MSGEEQLNFWKVAPDVDAFVYVIQGVEGSPIKVGTAKDPRKRLKSLQTGNPDTLSILYVVPGDHRLENSFHKRLKEARITGEWFGGEAAEEFIKWIAAYSVNAIDVYTRTGILPAAPPVPQKLNRVRFTRNGGYGAHLGHTWRLVDKEEPNPVTVRFVDPETLRVDPDTAREREQRRIRSRV